MEATLLKEVAKFLAWDHSWTIVGLTLLWGIKLLAGAVQRKKQRSAETLDKLVSHLENSSGKESVLSTELLFENHFGKPLSWNEIRFFRRTCSSAKNLKSFLQCMEYLEVNKNGSKIAIKNGKNLTIRRFLYFSLYTLFGMIAFGLLTAFPSIDPANILVWITLVASMVILAITALRQGAISSSAFVLYNELKSENLTV